MFDVVTFGEAMIRLAPPHFQRLEQTSTLDIQVGGGELNVAVGAGRLGLKSAWVSRLPKNPLGRLTENRVRQAGVDTSHLIWADSGRMGLYFVEFGAAPRASSVLYDRAELRHQPPSSRARWIGKQSSPARDGSTPAASRRRFRILPPPSLVKPCRRRKQAGVTVSYDLNYRGKLWTRGKGSGRARAADGIRGRADYHRRGYRRGFQNQG